MFTFLICFIAGIGAGRNQSDANYLSWAPCLRSRRNRIGKRRACKRCQRVYLRKKQKSGYRKRHCHDDHRPAFTLVGSLAASLVPNATMGGFSVFMTLLLGIKFIVKPVMTTKESMEGVSARKRIFQSILSGTVVGFICGFIGAGGGMMMLLLLTGLLGYELKTAVGTSVFIMSFTAFTGAASHFVIGGMPDIRCLVFCVASTLLWARIAARFANKASAATLNRATGVVLAVLGVSILAVRYLQ